MNYSRAHEEMLDERRKAPDVGTLKISLSKILYLQTSRLPLMSMIAILSEVFQ